MIKLFISFRRYVCYCSCFPWIGSSWIISTKSSVWYKDTGTSISLGDIKTQINLFHIQIYRHKFVFFTYRLLILLKIKEVEILKTLTKYGFLEYYDSLDTHIKLFVWKDIKTRIFHLKIIILQIRLRSLC